MHARNHVSGDEGPFNDYQQSPFSPDPKHASRQRRGRFETDDGEYGFVPAFPALSQARTTFHVVDLDIIDEEKQRRWDRLWRLQHNRGHTWDESTKTTVRTDATYRRCTAILQQCEVPDWCEKAAVSRVIHKDLTGFSRHYAGADGACIGFALLELYDEPSVARESFFACRAADVIPGLDSGDIDGLVDYVFREHGGA